MPWRAYVFFVFTVNRMQREQMGYPDACNPLCWHANHSLQVLGELSRFSWLSIVRFMPRLQKKNKGENMMNFFTTKIKTNMKCSTWRDFFMYVYIRGFYFTVNNKFDVKWLIGHWLHRLDFMPSHQIVLKANNWRETIKCKSMIWSAVILCKKLHTMSTFDGCRTPYRSVGKWKSHTLVLHLKAEQKPTLWMCACVRECECVCEWVCLDCILSWFKMMNGTQTKYIRRRCRIYHI